MRPRTALYGIAFCMLLLAAVAPYPAAAAQAEKPYNNSSDAVNRTGWTDGHSDVTLANTTHYVARLGTFVVGEDPDDPGAGPLITGILVMGVALGQLGTSRVGFIASSVLGVITAGALAQSAGLLPGWFYVVITMALGAVAAYQMKDQLR